MAPETFPDVELSLEEKEEALRAARERKFYRLQEKALDDRRAEMRRQLSEQWSYEQILGFAISRKDRLEADGGRKIDFMDRLKDGKTIENSHSIFDLLCYYFARDPLFTVKANEMGVPRPDLRKGLYLVGPIGCGKTTLMRIMQVNQRRVFLIKSAADIAREWRMADKEAGEYLARLSQPHSLPSNDPQAFYQRFAGLCIDDLGTEDIANSYGNRSNVIADLIEARYANQAMGDLFHVTTNLPATAIAEAYGHRVSSRLKETMNIIEYRGEDRRK